MQSLKKGVVLKLTSVNKCCFRNRAVSSASIALDNETNLKPWEEIPGPRSLPIIGQLHHFLPGQPLADMKNFHTNLFKFYGPIVKITARIGSPPMIFLYDPESIAYLLRSDNWSPKRPGFESLAYHRKYHNRTEEEAKQISGLVTDDGPNWRTLRTTVNPVLMHSETIRLYNSQISQVADDMINRMRSIRDKNNKLTKAFDVEMNLWALESIGTVALGGRLKCLSQNLSEHSPERRLIKCVHDLFYIVNELEVKPNLWKYLPTRNFKKAMKIYGELEMLTKHFIQKARNENFINNNFDGEKGILEKLLDINERIAMIMASDLLVAGVDTAATTMTATLYLLAKNQDVQDKLREELKTKDSRSYLKACIKESFRVMPAVVGTARLTQREYNILGYRVPKDFFIILPHQIISVFESEFPRPLDYIPERWIEEGPLYYKNTAHPFTYSPFGFGVRMCIGRRIAELEIETFLEKVIKNFKVEWNGPPPEVVPTTLNHIKGPFNFTFQDV